MSWPRGFYQGSHDTECYTSQAFNLMVLALSMYVYTHILSYNNVGKYLSYLFTYRHNFSKRVSDKLMLVLSSETMDFKVSVSLATLTGWKFSS